MTHRAARSSARSIRRSCASASVRCSVAGLLNLVPHSAFFWLGRTPMAILDAEASKYRDIALLIGRILLGVLFLIAAYNKAKGYGGAVGYFTKLGVPAAGVVAPLTILFEAAAGIL